MGTLQVLPPEILKTKLFEGFEQPEFRALVNKGELKTFQPGDIVLKEGESGDEFFYVVSGTVDVVTMSTAKLEPVTLKTLKSGDILGEMILLKKNSRSASAIVQTQGDLLVWNYKDCLDLFSSNPVLGYKLMRNLAILVANKLTDMNVLYKDK